MPRQFTEQKLVVATHNQGKLREIRSLLAPFGVEVVSAGELGLPEPAETETTFAGNAGIKSHAAAQASGLPALADDSGLEIDALGGQPGVYSADWAETPEGRDFAMAMERIRRELGSRGARPPFTARFNACLSLAWPDGHEEIVLGQTEGQIVWPPRGLDGFGYDPIFQPDGSDLTFGEMRAEQKNVMSHRARAFALLVEACFKQR
ncbi:RdgB/HAM1 family non-canonical purine NTP pyrophosphatase [Rhodobacteraceae bacterium NNCM2]|nr:RdgB/HAM1 family non-canonical purine NTP pyrophosphatase [Coraliihabitans acroporae]